MNKTLIILPCFNELETAPSLISEILKINDVDVLVVDDRSEDGTVESINKQVKDKRLNILVRKEKRSFANSEMDGFRFAIEKGYENIVTMDADGSHSPKYIPEMIKMLKQHDLVIGSRYMDGVSVVNWPIQRIAISLFANFLARKMLRLDVNDLTSGFMAMKIDVPLNLQLCAIQTQGYGYLIEYKWRSVRAGFRVSEFPIIFIERTKGQSKMSSKHAQEAFWMLLLLTLKERFLSKDKDC